MGQRKRLHKAEINETARAVGHYPYRQVGLDIKGGSPIGPGMVRAYERLAAKRKANAALPDASMMTRQRRRAYERALIKGRSVSA